MAKAPPIQPFKSSTKKAETPISRSSLLPSQMQDLPISFGVDRTRHKKRDVADLTGPGALQASQSRVASSDVPVSAWSRQDNLSVRR